MLSISINKFVFRWSPQTNMSAANCTEYISETRQGRLQYPKLKTKSTGIDVPLVKLYVYNQLTSSHLAE